MNNNPTNAFRALYNALAANGWSVTASSDGSPIADPSRATIATPDGPNAGAWFRVHQGGTVTVLRPYGEARVSRPAQPGDIWQSSPAVPDARKRPTVAEMLIAARAAPPL